jgi:hypothetical protein
VHGPVSIKRYLNAHKRSNFKPKTSNQRLKTVINSVFYFKCRSGLSLYFEQVAVLTGIFLGQIKSQYEVDIE